jgi:glucose/mannose-6-phosphate isomerase
MGGSAIGGDLAAAAIGERAERPIVTSRNYSPPPWVGSDALVLCSSYSGNTEETLAAFEAAGAAGARRIAVTTGGKLAEAARAAGVPVIGVPSGFLPRCAVAYMTVAVLECAALAGVAGSLRAEIEAASRLLGSLAVEWGPDSEDGSEAKRIARSLQGSMPVVYGAGLTEAVARRWKTQMNENAELPAFWAALPELDHNEICGWPGAGELGPMSAVFLQDREQHERTKLRVDLTAPIVARAAAAVERVESRGETAVERLMSLVFLGDLVSLYLSVLLGRDPSRMDAIDDLKAELG